MATVWITETLNRAGKWVPQWDEAMCWQTKQDGEDILFGEYGHSRKEYRVRAYRRVEPKRKPRGGK